MSVADERPPGDTDPPATGSKGPTKAESALTLLSDADWNAINQINDPANRRSVIAARVLLRIGLSHAAGHAVEPAD